MNSAQKDIARNIAIHDRIAKAYEREHGEIFNRHEQDRLHAALSRARDAVSSGSRPLRALDVGCGSGNLTRHLLDLGFEVVAADVSQGFLDLISAKFAGRPVVPHRLDGNSLAGLDDGQFDLVATYSVLHHIPDYLSAVREMGRVTRPGGVVYIDHEPSPAYWRGEEAYRRYIREGMRTDWRKYLKPANYYHRLKRFFDPRWSNEGDIHVWPDDHVEWDRVAAALDGFEVVLDEAYLLYRRLVRPEVHARYSGELDDTRLMAFRKCAA